MNAISYLIMLAALAIILIAVYLSNNNYSRRQSNSIPPPAPPHQQPSYFNLLDDDGNPLPPNRVPICSPDENQVPIKNLRYFCVKDKGYNVTVWPKDQYIGDYMEFNIAGIIHGEHVNEHFGEFIANLVPEPTNPYDPDAIKIVTANGHRIGYVSRNITAVIRDFTSLPCSCYCYVGLHNGKYFSDCYIKRKYA